ncbi:MAG: hypothetical protein KatS3mg065_1225 [Chloroflexota bacterium]|nr:MAG: hypothetical protein KatS3mg065_1225 [Chloroflexota bacterium]
MAMRRGARPPHVRPRPPSTGRPKPTSIKPRRLTSVRVTPRRHPGRARRLPLPARLLLALAVVVLGGAVLYAATGGLSRAVASLGGTIGAVVDRLTATPTPTGTVAVALDTPLLDAPSEPYTNRETVDLSGTIPTAFVARPDFAIRIYVTLPDASPRLVREIAVGATATFRVTGLELAPGRNDFTATLVGPTGNESDPSPVVTVILDTEPPKVTISSPKNGSVVNRDRVSIEGKTQARSAIVARNEANGATASAMAGTDGAFSLSLPLAPGTNGITVTATDPAGNSASTVLSVRRGSGQLTVALSANQYRFRQAELPAELQIELAVTDPDGRPLAGASVLFTVSIPGITPITSETVTGGDGIARFQTVIPKSAATGTGPIAALVTTDAFGSATDRTAITITK